MESFNMVANHAIRQVAEDAIFGANTQAQKAISEYGFNNVINGTIGVFLDDEGILVTFDSVFNALRELKDESFAAYAPLNGINEYLDTAIKTTFGDYKPDGFIEAVATPGGTGAIRHAVWNYSSWGEEILTSDWYWDPYNTIATEHGRKISTYKLFDEKMNFNFEDFESKVELLLDKQKRLIIIINSPAHNPTGFSLSYDEWLGIIEMLKRKASSNQNKIVLFIDIAYIDFCEDESRRFLSLLSNLPKNILSIVSYSMSKGYTFYGLRSGAIIGVSSNKDVAIEFKNACSHSNRGVWSNGTRCAMEVLTKIYRDESLLEKVEKERNHYKEMLKIRANSFMKASEEVGLEICPYKDGFFISIPSNDPIGLAKELSKEKVFLVPLEMGLRFAVCSVSQEKCKITPRLIKEAMKRI
ncbi:aminotransferase class I/II-fold pyridoxal phosphate-dependent enzyme [Alkalibaculum sporogenes]|uniref:aminotransferase class I/II-fold pyridoxal phosphate-dependent enzyme n=1 Tax=Alkalibaculum sporogenes TaxID=2655001 RepID=UPI00187B5E8F|nr:aminotransferase class I/II-fold pyridoxal phosphate-dependent enzyme [Alkalibaculum sporogenes]